MSTLSTTKPCQHCQHCQQLSRHCVSLVDDYADTVAVYCVHGNTNFMNIYAKSNLFANPFCLLTLYTEHYLSLINSAINDKILTKQINIKNLFLLVLTCLYPSGIMTYSLLIKQQKYADLKGVVCVHFRTLPRVLQVRLK